MLNILNSPLTAIIIAILIPIFAAIVPVIYQVIKERQGNRVLVNLVSVTPQLSVSEEIKKNLYVLYKGKPVDNVISYVFKVGNKGRNIIEPLDLTIIFIPENEDGKIEFAECETRDLMLEAKATALVFNSGKHGLVKLWRKFLNPYKTYKEEIFELVVLSNTKLIFSIFGGDKNWVLDSSSREPRNLEKSIKVNQYEKFFWVCGGISVLLIFLGLLFNGNIPLIIIGGIGIWLSSIYSVYQSVTSILDTNNFVKESKIRTIRVEQTYKDTEVLHEIKEFVQQIDFVKENIRKQ
jgi:hypothetical protein